MSSGIRPLEILAAGISVYSGRPAPYDPFMGAILPAFLQWCTRLRSVAQTLSLLSAATFLVGRVSAADAEWAAEINKLGCELLRGQAEGNAAVSPASLTTALLMTWMGTGGETRSEMTKALGYDQAFVDSDVEFWKTVGAGKGTTIESANRLFIQESLPLLPAFRDEMRRTFGAPVEEVDFESQSEKARKSINRWVEKATKDRIKDLIPQGGVDTRTRLVLANAVYFFAPWKEAFEKSETQPREFRLGADRKVDVPTMHQQEYYGYRKGEGFVAVRLPYGDPALQMLILLPDEVAGLPALERAVDAEMLREFGKAPYREVDLFLPRFRIETGAMELVPTLEKLGVKRLFDNPRGSADLSGMTEPGNELFVSKIFQKVFVDVTEKGTEAAAATGIIAMPLSAELPVEPLIVKVDRPFLFAIQHRDSGACLFLGRVTDPR